MKQTNTYRNGNEALQNMISIINFVSADSDIQDFDEPQREYQSARDAAISFGIDISRFPKRIKYGGHLRPILTEEKREEIIQERVIGMQRIAVDSIKRYYDERRKEEDEADERIRVLIEEAKKHLEEGKRLMGERQ